MRLRLPVTRPRYFATQPSTRSPNMSLSLNTPLSLEYTSDRSGELSENVDAVLAEIRAAAPSGSQPRLVSISKIKPASDIKALYDAGHRHFGENYIQEMVDKAAVLPGDIHWHFVGSLQSNKAKLAASVPNLYLLETLSSIKLADLLEKALADQPRPGRTLNVYLQVNTSSEDSKSGLSPMSSESGDDCQLAQLALHVLRSCPHLRILGLMTIGSWEASHDPSKPNPDFTSLKDTRRELARVIASAGLAGPTESELELSMGMSADFVQAVKEGSSSVRVGTRIFGQRPKKQ